MRTSVGYNLLVILAALGQNEVESLSWPTISSFRATSQSSTQTPDGAWFSDPNISRDRSRVIQLDESHKLPSARFILSYRGSVCARRDGSGVSGLFVPFGKCTPDFFGEGALVTWIGNCDSIDYWSLDCAVDPEPFLAGIDDKDAVAVAPLREFGDTMASRKDAALYATANGMTAFHRAHPYCSKCGSPTRSSKLGACRRCACGTTVYPRIDAAAIMLVESHCGNFALLGRKKNWPEGRWSTLAGFAEVCVDKDAFSFLPL